jgi:hypothetical protein
MNIFLHFLCPSISCLGGIKDSRFIFEIPFVERRKENQTPKAIVERKSFLKFNWGKEFKLEMLSSVEEKL